VSGNTIAVTRPELLPLHNLPVLRPRLANGSALDPVELAAAIGRGFQRLDLVEGEQPVAIAIEWSGVPRYALLRQLSEGIAGALPRTIASGLPVVIVFANDFGKLVGGILGEEFLTSSQSEVISIDAIELQEFDFIDIGEIIQPSQVVPVVVKSLVFPEAQGEIAELAWLGPAQAAASSRLVPKAARPAQALTSAAGSGRLKW
jgi:ethanolamine utilization protein EutA